MPRTLLGGTMYALMTQRPSVTLTAAARRRPPRRLWGIRTLLIALAMSGVAAFGARAELEVPVVTDGDRPFHRIYVVGKGDSREQDDAFAEDLNALITDLNQSKNHKSLNSISLIRPGWKARSTAPRFRRSRVMR